MTPLKTLRAEYTTVSAKLADLQGRINEHADLIEAAEAAGDARAVAELTASWRILCAHIRPFADRRNALHDEIGRRSMRAAA